MIFPYPILVIDPENRQAPNTPGWDTNTDIGAALIEAPGKVTKRFSGLGTGSGEEFMAWYKSIGSPRTTSFNRFGDAEKLEPMGVTVEWDRDIMAVAFAQMKIAGALRPLDKGPEGRLKWPTLEEAVEFYGVPMGEAHTIRGDVDMAVGVVIKMNEMSAS